MSWIQAIFDFIMKLFTQPAFKKLYFGMTGPEIESLQTKLKRLGYYASTVDGDFGPKTKQAVMDVQKDGGFLTIDGVVTKEVMAYIDSRLADPVKPTPTTSDDFGAPWIFANIDLLGRYETDPELNARYVPEWAKEGLPGYKTLAGNDHAWCSVRVNADFRKVGIKGTNSAAAASWSSWGVKCPFFFGAVLDIKHASGGRHVCNFLYWIDESKKIAATLDGNKGNQFCVAMTDLSGSGDRLVSGPRWPSGYPYGQFLSMKEVLAKHRSFQVARNQKKSGPRKMGSRNLTSEYWGK